MLTCFLTNLLSLNSFQYLSNGHFLIYPFKILTATFNSQFDHLYKVKCPLNSNCSIGLGKCASNYYNETVSCHLAWSFIYMFYFINYWFIIIALIFCNFICLYKLIKLAFSKKARLVRLEELLPTVNRSMVSELASNDQINSFFKIELLADEFQLNNDLNLAARLPNIAFNGNSKV